MDIDFNYQRTQVLKKMLRIAKSRTAKPADRVSAARLFLQQSPNQQNPEDEGAKQAREILEGLKESEEI